MLRAVIALCVVLALFSSAEAKRVALVIGNSAYVHAGTLANPKNDATDVAAALRKSGFEVIAAFDLDKASFDRKIRDFASALTGAEAGVFFYAGHGMQVGGRNYLVPIDAELTTAEAVDFEMVQLDVIHRTMERLATTNIIFLDACRNNPLSRNLARAMGTRSMEIGRGLAPVESGVGTLISFSTQPGNVALDGSGRNSPFAGALVQRITSSTEDLSALLIDVRNDVRKVTENKQVPWEHSALTGRFYFNQPAQSSVPEPSTQMPRVRLSEAAEAWAAAKDTTSIPVLQDFIARYRDTFYAQLAQARIAELRNQEAAARQKTETPKPADPGRTETAVAVARFNGAWRVEYFGNDYCTTSRHLVGQWTIANGVVVNVDGERGVISGSGQVELRRRDSSNPYKVYAIRAQLTGSHGRGNFQIEGRRCGGTLSLTRM